MCRLFCPPFLQDDGTPFLTLFAWLAVYSSSLLHYQVFQGEDLMDWQKNRLLWDLLGDTGRHQLGLHVDVVLMETDAMPHVAFLQAIRLHLQDWVNCNSVNEPSSTPSGTGKPRCTGVISFQSEEGCGRQWKQALKGDAGVCLWAIAWVLVWGAMNLGVTCVWCHVA